MRIISGKLKGARLFGAHRTAAHPMSEKIRNALFNSLGPLDSLSFLDLYGGTGAISLEAFSRGCADLTVIEIDPKTYAVLKKNILLNKATVSIHPIRADCFVWVKQHSGDRRFDVIVADPPFGEDRLTGLMEILLPVLKPQGLLVLSHSSAVRVMPPDGYQSLVAHQYARAALSYYRRAD